MEEKLEQTEYRQGIISYINGQENIDRKSKSLEDTQVYSGDIYPYVLKKFKDVYKAETVNEIPIVSTINVSEKVINSAASIYKDAPERNFHEVSGEQAETLDAVYNDMWFDTKMLSANRYFKLQKQTHVIVLPKAEKLQARILKQHQLDVIPFSNDPEAGEVYILTGFDKSLSTLRTEAGNGIDEPIADEDDYKASITRHVVWSKNYHFVMDGRGAIISGEDVANPIGMIPIVEISEDKDMEYFIQFVNNDTKFTVEYNEALSNQALVVKMQGFSQAVMMAPEGLMPSSVTVGPNKILKIITDGNLEGEVDFKFVNPGSDLAGVQSHTESLLSQYLSSKGLDANAITGNASNSAGHASGVSKLLAMVERFEASKDDLARFEQAEKNLFKVVRAWLNDAQEVLDEKYTIGNLSDNSSLSVQYKEPTAVMSEVETLDVIERKLDMGLISRVEAIAKDRNITVEQAEEVANGIEETEVLEERSIAEV
tara:strand:+ start:1417 stop:2868 length:1452 start_codon:yes stop_codon:yes gene_type:complete